MNDCKKHYQQAMSQLHNTSEIEEVFSYYGEISPEQGERLSSVAKEKLGLSNEHHTPQKRIFSVLVEGLENVAAYGAKNADGIRDGFVVLHKKSDSFTVRLGNLIKKKDVALFEEKDLIDLKDYYLDALTSGLMEEDGNGLGLVTIAIRSANTFTYTCESITDDSCCFILEVNVKM